MPIAPATLALTAIAAPLARQVLRQGAALFADVFAAAADESASAETPSATATPPSDGPILADIQADLDITLTTLHQRLKEKLSAAGHDLFSPFELRVNQWGEVAADNHPLADEVNQILASDHELANDVRRVVAHAQLLRAAERHAQFADQYAHDPGGAARLLDQSRLADQGATPGVLISKHQAEIVSLQ